MKRIVLFLLIAASFFKPSQTFAAANKHDSLVLVDFYNSANGAGWLNKWNLVQPINTWYGITLGGRGKVIQIKLSGNGLNGSLPFDFGGLDSLNYLDLSVNFFTSMPTSIGNLSNLMVLNLSKNAIFDSVPSNIFKLTNLTTLNLGGNDLFGTLPSFIGNLSKLTVLNLNQYGDNTPLNLPSSMKKLTNLQELDLEDWDINGGLPSFIGEFSNLSVLDLFAAHLNELLPSFIGNLTNLTILNLAANRFTGSIPSSFQNLTKLQTLNLSNNLLSGSLSPLNDLNNLTSLDISSNLFTFTGMETIARKFPFTVYSPQNTLLPVNYNAGVFSVSAGGTLAHNKYQWYKNGKLSKTITGDSTFTPQSTAGATFIVYVTNSVATALTLQGNPYIFPALFDNTAALTDANQVDKNFSAIIYPNPVHSSLNLKLNSAKAASMQVIIMNNEGKILLSKQAQVAEGASTQNINAASLSSGVYYVRLITAEGESEMKFVKE